MQHWSRLATRNWQARKVRTLGAVFAVAIGTAVVVWVACCNESIRQAVLPWAGGYVGNAHITVSSMRGKHDQIPQRLVAQLEKISNVKLAAPRLLQRRSCRPVTRTTLAAMPEEARRWSSEVPDVDLHGLDLKTEFTMRTYPLTAGRMLEFDDTYACVLEAAYAEECGVAVGDYLLVWDPSQSQPFELEIIGLFERRRIAKFQKPLALMRLPVLQRMTQKSVLVSTIDVTLADTDRKAVRKAAALIHRRAVRTAGNARVRSAEARMKQIEFAQNNQRLVMVMLSSVAMLTALFIILSTLSMGLLERVQQLGLLRCVGTTRWQLAALVMLEVIPLGAAGVVVGVPLGLGLTVLTVWLVPDYVGAFAISWSGIALAGGAGMATTVLAASLPALAAWRISPMEAARPRTRRSRDGLLVVIGAAALLLLTWQHYGLVAGSVRSPNFLVMAASAVVALYVAYALIAPAVVRLIGSPAVVAAAGVLRVRTRLLQDQVGYAVWRSAGICCGLMVGLSLVVGMIVVNDSVSSGWQFPTQFPAAYVWTFGEMGPDAADRIAKVPGVGGYTVANSINVIVEERPVIGARLLRSYTWFMGVDPDTFMELVKLEFLEGDETSARDMLKQGGYVVIADDFARSRNKHINDNVRVWDERVSGWRHFKVAAVVRSPALDIAAGYFQMHSEYSVVASGSVMGTNADVKRVFGIDGANLALLNFDLPDERVPADWPPARDSVESIGVPARFYDDRLPVEQRWRRWREREVLRDVRRELRSPGLNTGTVAELKDEIDTELTRMTRLLTAIPGVALVVAAIGVANLMTANVTARAKQLAILRAVGATRGLVLRMVVGEAVVLGLLGSALGLVLGFHLAANITELVDRMWGFKVALSLPWGYVIGTIIATVGLCVIAGILPARHASRTNIVDALHVT